MDALICSRYKERNCLWFVKWLRVEESMFFTFLEKECDWHNNTTERTIRSSVVIRKITCGNKSITRTKAHAVLMNIRETCKVCGQNFYEYELQYLENHTSKR